MSVRALIFDVDGTLADTEEAHRQAFNAAFRAHGLAWNWDRALYRDLLRVAGGKERIAHYVERLSLAQAQKNLFTEAAAELHHTKTRCYTGMVEGGQVPLRPGVERLIAEARAVGLKLAIATSTSAPNVEALLRAGLGDRWPGLFSAIACGDMARDKKPAPGVYLLALETLALAAAECIAFEDSANGLRAARAAGLFTVVTPTAWTAGEDFSAADLLLDNLAEPGADLRELARRHAGSAARTGSPMRRTA